MIQSNRTETAPIWIGQTENRRAIGSAVAGTVFLILGITLGVILMDRLMPASLAAAEQAMAPPLGD